MSMQPKFSEQETKVINYLISRNNSNVYWEELAQFSKDPETVKLKTIKKIVSEIRRKYVTAELAVPFNVSFHTMTPEKEGSPPVDAEAPETTDTQPAPALTIGDLIREKLGAEQPQILVQVKRKPSEKKMVVTPPSPATVTPPAPTPPTHVAHADFIMDRNTRRVRTKFGIHNLNDSEWEVFKYFHTNVGKLIPISEIRDKVVYPQWGSKLPARWFDAIMRIINNMRRAVTGLDRRLLTVKGVETSYLFQ